MQVNMMYIEWVVCCFCIFIVPITHKNDTFEEFQRFKAIRENETGRRITKIRSDRGGEFKSEHFKKYCDDHGILSRTYACIHPPTQRSSRTQK